MSKRIPLGKICRFIGGAAFPERHQGEIAGELPFYKVSDTNAVENAEMMFGAANFVTRDVAKSLRANIIPAGATIFPKVGAALLTNKRRLTSTDCCIDNNLMAAVPLSDEPRFVYELLQSLDFSRIVQPGALPSITKGQLEKLEVAYPLELERKAISKLSEIMHKAQRRLDELLEAKRAFKHALLHELLTGRRRFPEFTGTEVPMVPLGEVAIAGAVRNRGVLDEKHVMGVLKDSGMVPMRDHVRAQDLSRYQIVPPDGFAYNPMRLNIGSIARNLSDANCLVSPDYVVFTANASALLPQYLDQVRWSQIWSDFVRPAGSGSVRVRIYFRDLAELCIPLPSLPEQRRIADTLEAADREIVLLEHLRDTYESQKRALMHRLLSGDLSLTESATSNELVDA